MLEALRDQDLRQHAVERVQEEKELITADPPLTLKTKYVNYALQKRLIRSLA